jgi:dolichyl-phosphate beta-glucosyltransferase
MLSIIIPSYKGVHILKKNLPGLQTYLADKKIVYEIIVVDDGSEDNGATGTAVEALGCTFIENPKNMGKGASVRNGINKAKGDFIIFTDVDIPFEYDAIPTFLYYLDFKEFDVVVGDRTLEESNYFTEIPKSRKLGSAVFSFFVGRFVTTGIYDTQCGIKGFRAKVAKDIFSKANIDGFTFDVELLYIALKRNYDIKRLPVKLRSQEESSVSLLKHAVPMVYDLFRIKYNHLKGAYKR